MYRAPFRHLSMLIVVSGLWKITRRGRTQLCELSSNWLPTWLPPPDNPVGANNLQSEAKGLLEKELEALAQGPSQHCGPGLLPWTDMPLDSSQNLWLLKWEAQSKQLCGPPTRKGLVTGRHA